MLSNLFSAMPPAGGAQEAFDDLFASPGLRIERIVSHGHASPPGFWYEQDWDEWVLLLQGQAVLEVEGRDGPLRLAKGDHAWLPAGCRHRVAYTSTDEPTLWLAVHRGKAAGQAEPAR